MCPLSRVSTSFSMCVTWSPQSTWRLRRSWPEGRCTDLTMVPTDMTWPLDVVDYRKIVIAALCVRMFKKSAYIGVYSMFRSPPLCVFPLVSNGHKPLLCCYTVQSTPCGRGHEVIHLLTPCIILPTVLIYMYMYIIPPEAANFSLEKRLPQANRFALFSRLEV